ncbi:MAG: phosphate acyltransferase PlsX [Turicibacter sp.]|nr:phosphate acyltransferase PlsX [Turicibacter sp.]
MEKTVIAIDASGGDNAPTSVIGGVALAIDDKSIAADILLVGDSEIIERELEKANISKTAVSILHAPDIITPDEVPTTAVRRKKQSSIVVGTKAVKEGTASAFVSAGSTGALLSAATVYIGRAEGIERPALGVMLPNRSGFTLLIDCGANVDCKPAYLAQFAQMGSDYMSKIRGIKAPTVGLINIGTESEKGNTLVKEAYPLLEQAGVNFIGNVEAREVPLGKVDVAVCDAFVGNVLLKYTEGLATGLMGVIKDELLADPISKIGALLAKRGFKRVRKRFNHDDVGGAPFLGLKSLVVKAHGSSNANAIYGAIRQCDYFNKANVN